MSRKLLLQAAVLDFMRHTGAGEAAELAQKTWGVPPNMPVVRTRNSFLLDWWLQMWKAEEGMLPKGRHASPFPAGGQGQDSSSDPPSIAGPQQRPGQGNGAATTPRKPSPNASSCQEQLSVSHNMNSPSPCLPALRVDSGHATSTCKHHLDSDSSALMTTCPQVGSPLVGSSGAPPSSCAAEGPPAVQQQQQQLACLPQQQSHLALGPVSPQLQKQPSRPGRKPARRGVDDPAAVALLARYAAATSQRAPTLAELCERAAARAPRQPAQPRRERERQQHAGTDTDTDGAWEEGEEGGSAGMPVLRPKRMRGGWARQYTEDADLACDEGAAEGEGWDYGYDYESGFGSDSKRQRRERPPPGSYARLAAIRFHQRRGRPRSAGSLRMQQRRQQHAQQEQQQLAVAQLQQQQAAGCPAASPAPLADFPDIPEDLLALGDSGCFDLFPGPDMAAVAGWDLAGAAADDADAGAGAQGSAGVDACCVTASDLEGVFDDPLDVLLPLPGPPGSGALPLAW